MRIRRILAAVIATTALAGLGLTGAATATAESLTPGECTQGGGTVDWAHSTVPGTGTCKGGTHNGQTVD
ncbi:hypothetical protein ACH41H_27920 [Streptomyces sp. NPDC020800]|uniref:hypothetical protein n=1 Tax=Streptomyces sp. NPDC020800 TaxID=3365092 RepID=UPI0037A8F97B